MGKQSATTCPDFDDVMCSVCPVDKVQRYPHKVDPHAMRGRKLATPMERNVDNVSGTMKPAVQYDCARGPVWQKGIGSSGLGSESDSSVSQRDRESPVSRQARCSSCHDIGK